MCWCVVAKISRTHGFGEIGIPFHPHATKKSASPKRSLSHFFAAALLFFSAAALFFSASSFLFFRSASFALTFLTVRGLEQLALDREADTVPRQIKEREELRENGAVAHVLWQIVLRQRGIHRLVYRADDRPARSRCAMIARVRLLRRRRSSVDEVLDKSP